MYYCRFCQAEIFSALYLSAWQKTNLASKLLHFPVLSVLMSSVCKHFRNGYVDRYRRRLTTYSIKMTNMSIHGMYFLLSHFFSPSSDHNCLPYFCSAENQPCEMKVLTTIFDYLHKIRYPARRICCATCKYNS